MEQTTEILTKILLPLDSGWEIKGVKKDDSLEEIEVELHYILPYIQVGEKRYSIYDHRSSRRWRHLDLWQYKTYISARLPRYKDEAGFYHTIAVPWAESGEQMSLLLEKKL